MPLELLELTNSTPSAPHVAIQPVHRRPATRRVGRWKDACAMAACAALALFLYGPTLGFDFLNWDDGWYVVDNPLIRSWHPANLYRIATEVAVKNYAPLTVLSFLIDYTVWGLRPAGFHLTNILLHAVNVILVYVLLHRLTGSRFIGSATAALFAVHPLQVESVAWISSRKGLLSGTFILASLIFWLRPERRARDEGYGLLFYVAALLSKALAIVLPPVVLLYDVLVRRQTWSAAIARQFVPGVMAVLLMLITMTAQNTEIGGIRSHMELGKPHILAVDSIIIWKYIGMLLVPRDLCVLYDQPTSGIAGQVALALLAWSIVGFVTCRARKRFPLAVLGVLSFFLFLFPVLNFFPITTLMNDRYLYLPSIPIFALMAAGIRAVATRVAAFASPQINRATVVRRNMLAAACTLGIVFCYTQSTQVYIPVWKDGMSLWTDAVSKVPQLAVVQIQMANSLHAEGDDEAAVRVLEHALAECRPDELDRRRIVEKIETWRAN